MRVIKLIGRDRGLNDAMSSAIAHLAGVHDELGDVAQKSKTKAQTSLAQHRHTGAAKITVSEGDVDWYVNLEDEAAMSIEFGHYTKKGDHVQGLYIISKATGWFS